ncbi:MAG: ORF6C domain-containing protein, partial [Anaerolineae bacterium]|nr:ORF6C domain-containing protein [Anaerolineae bacterium]
HFQREAAKVLWEAFQEGRLTADPLFEDLLQQDTPEVQAYKMIQGMLQLARNQILLKSRLDDHEQRLEAIESQLAAPAHTISQSQSMQISQAVKAVAFEYGKQTKRNEHPAVYGEMYRRFEITSYKLLPAARFQECMDWLTEWYTKVTGQSKIPF